MSQSGLDLIIRIKNGYMARREQIESPHSVFREEILKKLVTLGYVETFEVEGEVIKSITITLKYDKGTPSMTDVKIYSKPGSRYYTATKKIKSVLGGLGVGLLTTPKGILTNKEAKKKKVGGELLFEIW